MAELTAANSHYVDWVVTFLYYNKCRVGTSITRPFSKRYDSDHYHIHSQGIRKTTFFSQVVRRSWLWRLAGANTRANRRWKSPRTDVKADYTVIKKLTRTDPRSLGIRSGMLLRKSFQPRDTPSGSHGALTEKHFAWNSVSLLAVQTLITVIFTKWEDISPLFILDDQGDEKPLS